MSGGEIQNETKSIKLFFKEKEKRLSGNYIIPLFQ